MFNVDDVNRASGYIVPTDPQYPNVPWFASLLACTACTLRQEARRVVPGDGPLSAEICVIGQNPGEDEDQKGVAFVGRGGDELNAWLRMLGLRRDRILVTNICKCHSERNRAPRPKEITTCETLWWKRELESFPSLRVVIPLGRPALFGLVGKLPSLPDVMEPWWMIADIPDTTRALHIVPLAHPAYLLRTPTQRPVMYDRVLPTVRDYLKREVPDAYQRAAA